jgi:hypothetical protein
LILVRNIASTIRVAVQALDLTSAWFTVVMTSGSID